MSLNDDLPKYFALAAMVVISASLLLGILRILWRRVPYTPRGPVPWLAIDIFAVLLTYVVIQFAAVGLAARVLAPAAGGAAAIDRTKEVSNEHVVGRLMSQGSIPIIVLCVVSAGVVAPVAEEFFFRVLLQGWLERLGRRWRRKTTRSLRWIPRGLPPVLITSMIFAGMHYRGEPTTGSPHLLAAMLVGDAVAKCVAVLLAVGYFLLPSGATAADFGWVPGKIRGDVRLGLVSFAALAIPIYGLQIGLSLLLPDSVAPDPIPLFFLALALGALYFRTHRIVPLVVLHSALNITSLLLASL